MRPLYPETRRPPPLHTLPLQVVTVHQLWVPCFIHQTCADYLFLICMFQSYAVTENPKEPPFLYVFESAWWSYNGSVLLCMGVGLSRKRFYVGDWHLAGNEKPLPVLGYPVTQEWRASKTNQAFKMMVLKLLDCWSQASAFKKYIYLFGCSVS